MAAATLPDPTFNLAEVPFSRRGSFFAVSRLAAGQHGPEGVYLRTVHGDARQKALFRLELLHNGTPVDFVESATPWAVTLTTAESGEVRIALTSTSVALSGAGVALRLWPVLDSPYDLILEVAAGRWQYTAYGANFNMMLAATAGHIDADPGWNGLRSHHGSITVGPRLPAAEVSVAGAPPPLTGAASPESFHMVITEFLSTYAPHEPLVTLADAQSSARDDFNAWPQLTTSAPERYRPARDLAAYVNWASLVGPSGNLARESMLMSKNWMTRTWSWDHCFNAMALTRSPRLATDQFLTIFDHQDANGALPDSVDDANITFNFAKPPIHGWAWRWMMRRMQVDISTSAQVYDHLARLTNWWTHHRVTGSGLPHYRHGNDSGWDNSTAFRRVVPIESPDLCAFLILQLDALSELAGELGLPSEQAVWRKQADEILHRLLAELWVDGRFVARGVIDREPIVSNSLLMLIPLVLGERLPRDIFDALTRQLTTNDHLTPRGLATEGVNSGFYEADGYWRGPMWAPSTFIIHEGLKDGGRPDVACVIAQRFCDTVKASGMAENFDARTGAGLRDRAYTWTASVFLILAERIADLEAVADQS